MLIISDYKDYYDSSIAYGVDKKVVYNRKEGVLEDQIIPALDNIDVGWHKFPQILLICGKFFPFMDAMCYKTEPRYIYKDTKYTYDRHHRFYTPKFNEILNDVHNQLSTIPEKTLMDINIKYNSPIVLISHENGYTNKRYTVTVNPNNLKDRGFTKQMDSCTLFQEIAQFVSTNNEPDMEVISDKDKLTKHGFDKKSFKHRG